MRGFPHSNEPEETMKVEPWVGVSPSGLMQMMSRGNESPARYDEARGRGSPGDLSHQYFLQALLWGNLMHAWLEEMVKNRIGLGWCSPR